MYPGPAVSPRATTRSTVMQSAHIPGLSRMSTVAVLSCRVARSLGESGASQAASQPARATASGRRATARGDRATAIGSGPTTKGCDALVDLPSIRPPSASRRNEQTANFLPFRLPPWAERSRSAVSQRISRQCLSCSLATFSTYVEDFSSVGFSL
ncbi:MAG: hypothetical protein F4151_06175 [Gammaproteobacteria bacterium]|nr:hypothetical protein [Gammaproteobacteria bacterium]